MSTWHDAEESAASSYASESWAAAAAASGYGCKPAYTVGDWKTLRELYQAVMFAEKTANERCVAVNIALTEDGEACELATTCQNAQIRVEMYKRQVTKAKERVEAARMRCAGYKDLIQDNAMHEKKIADEASTSNEESQQISAEIRTIADPLQRAKNELTFRRRYMLFELCAVYFADRTLDRPSTKKCSCDPFEVIRGLHLPKAKDRAGHDEDEYTGALGHIVNILSVVSRLLDYPLACPVFFRGSKSFLIDRGSHQIYNLFNPNAKQHRERFTKAMMLLNKNVVQFRSDIGLQTLRPEDLVSNLRDALFACTGKSGPKFIHPMPRTSPLDVATIVPVINCLSMRSPSASNGGYPTSKRPGAIIGGENILDVVSAKNETFDIQQLVRNHREVS